MTDPEGPETTSPEAEPSTTADQAPDHHAWVVYLGVLALLLLFIGAVGVSAQGGPAGSDQPDANIGQAGGHRDEMKAERRARHEAEKQRRAAERQQRKAAKQERTMGHGQGSDGSGDPDEDAVVTPTQQTGTVAISTTADGEAAYVLQTASGAIALDVGPPRYWGADHPLAPLVGQMVTVTGVLDADSRRLAVWTVGDVVIRGAGRPPWAGGGKADGQQAPTTSPMPSPSGSPSTAP